MIKINEKYESDILLSNKFSLISTLLISIFTLMIYGTNFIRLGHILIPLMVLSYILAFLFLIKIIWNINDKFKLGYYYYILFGLTSLFFALNVIIRYYSGEPLIDSQRWVTFGIGVVLSMLNNKCLRLSSYLICFQLYIVFI